MVQHHFPQPFILQIPFLPFPIQFPKPQTLMFTLINPRNMQRLIYSVQISAAQSQSPSFFTAVYHLTLDPLVGCHVSKSVKSVLGFKSYSGIQICNPSTSQLIPFQNLLYQILMRTFADTQFSGMIRLIMSIRFCPQLLGVKASPGCWF